MLRYNSILLLITLLLSTATACSSTKSSQIGDSRFEYRDVFLPENTGLEKCKLSPETETLNRVDNEWGIWGHNLEKILGGNLPDECYMRLGDDGSVNKKQLCFSSQALFDKVCEWIVDNYGSDVTTRFTIFPRDNKLCCTCKDCRKKGNTTISATPAVTDFVVKLCKKFPKHIFFTSCYHSTNALPTQKLPDNAGVMISAITWILKNEINEKEINFKKKVGEWAKKTDRIYVWEYINNYEDYFTPFPCIALMQKRIQYYDKAGVKGLFFNGSGYDYSSFSDLKVYALAELMKDPYQNWEDIIRDFFRQNYPESHKLLEDFYISIEKNSMNRRKYMDPYAAVDAALKEYLDADSFIKFYDELGKRYGSVAGEEGEKLQKLYSACTLTRLEIAKMRGKKLAVPDVLRNTPPSKVYSEEGWTVEDYINKYEK